MVRSRCWLGPRPSTHQRKHPPESLCRFGILDECHPGIGIRRLALRCMDRDSRSGGLVAATLSADVCRYQPGARTHRQPIGAVRSFASPKCAEAECLTHEREQKVEQQLESHADNSRGIKGKFTRDLPWGAASRKNGLGRRRLQLLVRRRDYGPIRVDCHRTQTHRFARLTKTSRKRISNSTSAAAPCRRI